MHNGTIIAEVTKRARASWNGPALETFTSQDPENDAWRMHWINTGKLWAKECRDQGLEETAKTIDKHIEWFERMSV